MVQPSTRRSPERSQVLQARPPRRARRAGAAPLETRRLKPRLEVLEVRTVPTVNLITNYTGFSGNGAPDPQGAAGTTNYVETVNQSIAIFTPKTTGATNISRTLSDFFFTQGKLTQLPTSGLSDPVVVWDNLVNRFIVGDQNTDNTNHADTFLLAVSKSASPTTLTAMDWWFYNITTTETNRNADYPGNLGFNADALVFTLNQNQAADSPGSDVQVTSAKMSDLISGNGSITQFANNLTPGTNVFVNDIPTSVFPAFTSGGQHTTRPTVMHDSVAGDPMWLLESTIGGGSSINVIKMANVLSAAPTYTTTAVPVNAYSSVVQPLQPDGTGIPPASGNGALWTHILKAAEYNNTIVASDQVSVSSTQDDARWYAFDVSGTPTIKAGVGQGDINPGNNRYDVFPAIDIAPNGDIGMTYVESGGYSPAQPMGTANEFMSMYVTGRNASDAANTMQAPVLVKAGVGNNKDGREGDLSGINVDVTPLTVTAAANQSAVEGASTSINVGSFADSEGNFFGVHEWAGTAGGGYSTQIGQFSLTAKGPWSVDVDWGDSGPHDTFSVTTPDGLGSRTHTYGEERTYTVTVKVTDTSDGHSDSKTFTVTVTDPAVAQGPAVAVSAVEGAAFTGKAVATYTDPGGAEPNPSDPTDGIPSHYKVVSINWGDATPLDTASGAISYADGPGSKTAPFTVSGSHTYGEEGTYTITVVINHEGILSTLTSTAHVSDPAVLAAGVPVTGKEGIAFAPPVATFTDPGGAEPNPSDPTDGIPSHYTATIDWGDGMPASAATITFSGTPGSKTDAFTVSGSHTFAEEGTFTVTVTINHEGIITTVHTTSTVRDNFGLLLLDPTDDKALMVTGNGNVTVNNNGAVVVDSSDPRAIFLTGNAVVSAAEADVGLGGDVVTHGHAALNLSEPEFNHEAATPDPIALPLPPMPATHFAAVHYSGSAPLTLSPGTYDGGIFIDGSGPVTLLPGVFYMNGGGFTVTGRGSVTGTGVLLVNAPSGPGDTVSVTGKGSVTLTASTTLPDGLAPYDGIAVFQDPASANTVTVTGQGSLTVTGTVYAPDALLKIDGNGNVVVSAFSAGHVSLGGIVVANEAMVTGNGGLTINADPAPAFQLGAGSVGLAADNGGLLASRFALRTGPLLVAVTDAGGDPSAAEQARIADAIAGLNAALKPFGVDLVEAVGAERAAAAVRLDIASTTDFGGVAAGVLAVTEHGDAITVVSSWDWYLGADPAGIGPRQFDFETVVAHEMAHAVGLGEGLDPSSVMYTYLPGGVARRELSAGDLINIAFVEGEGQSPAPAVADGGAAGLGLTAGAAPTASGGHYGTAGGTAPSDTTASAAVVAALEVAAAGTSLAAPAGTASALPPVMATAGNPDVAGPRLVLAMNDPTRPAVLFVTGAVGSEDVLEPADAPAAAPAAAPDPGDGAADTPNSAGRDAAAFAPAVPSEPPPAPAARAPDVEASGLLRQAQDAYFAAVVEAPVLPLADSASEGGGGSGSLLAAGLALGLGGGWAAPCRQEEELRRRPLLK
jgi:hypothetical protein